MPVDGRTEEKKCQPPSPLSLLTLYSRYAVCDSSASDVSAMMARAMKVDPDFLALIKDVVLNRYY